MDDTDRTEQQTSNTGGTASSTSTAEKSGNSRSATSSPESDTVRPSTQFAETDASSRSKETIENRNMPTLGEKLSAKGKSESGEADSGEVADESEWIWTPSYSARKSLGSTIRLVFRCPKGVCISLPYASLIDIQFIADEGQEYEYLMFDYTPYWQITVHGHNLEEIFNKLQSHSVAWLRQGNAPEKTPGQAFIYYIDYKKLTDPAVTLAALEYQRKTLLDSPD